MKKINKTKLLAVIFCIALIAMSALFLYSCESKEEGVLGKGKTSFNLQIIEKDGTITNYVVKTDEKTVAAALQHKDVNMIPSDMDVNDFNTIKGIKADFEADFSYWAFYIEGEMAWDSAYNTDVVEGYNYAFKYTVFDPDAPWDGQDDEGVPKG